MNGSLHQIDLPVTPRRMGEWRDRGACASQPTSLFFPERGAMAPVNEAKAICAGCPVKAECLEWALTLPEEAGIWGGTSARERRAMPRPVKICRDCGEDFPIRRPGDSARLCRPCAARRHVEQNRQSHLRKAAAS